MVYEIKENAYTILWKHSSRQQSRLTSRREDSPRRWCTVSHSTALQSVLYYRVSHWEISAVRIYTRSTIDCALLFTPSISGYTCSKSATGVTYVSVLNCSKKLWSQVSYDFFQITMHHINVTRKHCVSCGKKSAKLRFTILFKRWRNWREISPLSTQVEKEKMKIKLNQLLEYFC